MKSRRQLLLAPCALLLPRTTFAQPAGRMRVIGVLGDLRRVDSAVDPFRTFSTALAERGWIEGKTIAFVHRRAEPRSGGFAEPAAELVALGVDLIVVINAGVTAALAAKQATSSIPILAIGVADPVKFGLVASLARPGANVTGFAATATEWGKYVELAREALVGVERVAVIANPTNVVYADYVAANEAAAAQLGLRLQIVPVAQASDLAAAFEVIGRERAEALIFGPDRVFFANLNEILERAQARGLPVLAPFRVAAERGALLSYGFDGRSMLRHAAEYADRLLRGARPADLPVEQPTRFELVVNLRTAKALGIKLPQSLRLRADEVIE